MTMLVVFDKYSDWLEAYSAFLEYPSHKVVIHFLENQRNDYASMDSLVKGLGIDHKSELNVHRTHISLFEGVFSASMTLSEGDVIVAPFIRYRELWKIISSAKNVMTIHISESIPDAFGLIGFRLGFRGLNLKNVCLLPFTIIFALLNRPGVCFFPLMPVLKNDFVKETKTPHMPILINEKKILLDNLLGDKKRTLIVDGFGYCHLNMAKHLGLNSYVASSKAKELIVDGKIISIPVRISAEEILLHGLITDVVSYNSSTLAWIKFINPNMPIKAFISKELDLKYGSYTYYSRRVFNKMEIDLFPENTSMLI